MSENRYLITHGLENVLKEFSFAIIGGSGLYEMEGLEDIQEHWVDTPFGKPSDAVVTGKLEGVAVAFLARHGRGHKLLPSEVPYRANIYALKTLGVRYLLSISAVGSLAEDMRPLDMVIPDQMMDLTKRREASFFGAGAVAHVAMAQPICPKLAELLSRACLATVTEDVRVHTKGTYVCIEGPAFSTRAESEWYRSMGAKVIGMTNMPEAKLAREAEIAYATLALVTDYDCWHPREAHVTADMAIANLMRNAATAQRIARHAVGLLARERPSSIAHDALSSSLVTPIAAMEESVKQRLAALLASRISSV
jgi:5'-methylthioadenosine phosphorylase